jgi:hypothetical protein
MGVDACIYFKTKTGDGPKLYNVLPAGAKIVKAQEWGQEGSTHEVEQRWRYYGPGYERGPWPLIAATLMSLMASEDVETVWYYGDCSDGDEAFTTERMEQYNRHYIKNGDRPYRRAFKWANA